MPHPHSRLAAATLLALGLCVALAPAARAEKVVYGTASRVGLANAAMFMTEVLGFFREENIELETVQFDGTGVLMPQLANKSVTFGYPIPDPVIISHDKGKTPLPIKFFYNANRTWNWEIVVPANSPITTLADLKGKSIGVIALSVGNVPVTRSMLREAGLKPGEDVQLVAVGQGPATVNAFRTGRVDALNLFDVVHTQIEQDGFPIRRIPTPHKYLGISGNSFATHEDTIRDRPDLVRRFGRAYAKGVFACETNPEGCVRAMWRLHPSSKPTSGDEAKIMADSIQVLVANMRNKIPPGVPAERRYGNFDGSGWAASIQVLSENGLIQDPKIDASKLYTNEFVADFSKFDRDEVIARAKAFK